MKSAEYTSLVRPTLEYASVAWDRSANEDIAKLEKVQRQVARIINSNYHSRTPGCVTTMVSDLGWGPLQNRRWTERQTTTYKVQRGLVETDTNDIIRPSDNLKKCQQQLYQPGTILSVYKYCFLPRTIQECNNLPTCVTVIRKALHNSRIESSLGCE